MCKDAEKQINVVQTEPWCIQSSSLYMPVSCVRWKPRKWKEERNRRWNCNHGNIISYHRLKAPHVYHEHCVRYRHRGPARRWPSSSVQLSSQYCSKELSLILPKNIFVYTKSQSKIYLIVGYHHTPFFHLNVSHPDRRWYMIRWTRGAAYPRASPDRTFSLGCEFYLSIITTIIIICIATRKLIPESKTTLYDSRWSALAARRKFLYLRESTRSYSYTDHGG